MAGLVLELQREALDRNVLVSDLLRKALVVSKKLAISEIGTWIKNELAGYYTSDEESIPDYRNVRGEVSVYDPYQGCWQPLNVGTSELENILSIRKINQPVGELDSLVNDHKEICLQVPFNQSVKNTLMKRMNVQLNPTLIVPQTAVVGILEAIRNEILNWSLDLESRDILGNGMSFSKEEKQAASQTNYHVTNHIGSMQNSQLQQDSAGASQTLNVTQPKADVSAFIEELKASMHDLGLNKDDTAELEAEVFTIEHQLGSPKPKNIIINESLKSARSIMEGITGSVLATGLLAQLTALM
ncbi:hypothetical protein [Moritella sp.]|uniref:AbiTii domain-containing protein n=1 Tax=Moritella sp. TaxID=78556 RepID=UPI0025F96624|nr:hypothetical protein [Moritella sp.]MCJ8352306.1 hypothetical protein [Moritella sp.]